MTIIAGIEAGGTKFICGVGDAHGRVFDKVRIETTTPSETMPAVLDYFQSLQEQYPFEAFGIGTFGPIDPNPLSPNYGSITTSAKTKWQSFNMVSAIRQSFDVPIGFDTDVNAAALGEAYWGAAQNCQNFIYLTVGTGIGGGAMVNGQLLHGGLHPEMGHCYVPKFRTDQDFKGICPCHGDCLEGLASGPALNMRWGVKHGSELPPEHPAWQEEAHYLAYALNNLICTLAPERIILGGGVMAQSQLYPLIRERLQQKLNGYVSYPQVKDLKTFVVAPGLKDSSGLCGALALAEHALSQVKRKFNHDNQPNWNTSRSPLGQLSDTNAL